MVPICIYECKDIPTTSITVRLIKKVPTKKFLFSILKKFTHLGCALAFLDSTLDLFLIAKEAYLQKVKS